MRGWVAAVDSMLFSLSLCLGRRLVAVACSKDRRRTESECIHARIGFSRRQLRRML